MVLYLEKYSSVEEPNFTNLMALRIPSKEYKKYSVFHKPTEIYVNSAELHGDGDSTTQSDIIDDSEEDPTQVQVETGNESTVEEDENTVVEQKSRREDPVAEDNHHSESHMSIL